MERWLPVYHPWEHRQQGLHQALRSQIADSEAWAVISQSPGNTASDARGERIMATWTPDPSFYPSPPMAMKAAPETLAYVAAFDLIARHRMRSPSSTSIPNPRPIRRSSARQPCLMPATSFTTSAG